MTRRTDGKIAFGIKEWIAIIVLVVGVATAWARMEVRQAYVEQSIHEIKADQKEQGKELKELRRDFFTNS